MVIGDRLIIIFCFQCLYINWLIIKNENGQKRNKIVSNFKKTIKFQFQFIPVNELNT